jgi:hypothetical protein
MDHRIAALMERIEALHGELDEEIARRAEAFRYRVRGGRMEFDAEMRRRHRELRERAGSFLARSRPLVVLTAPVVYSVIVALVILDLFVTLYQAVCFPVYRIPRVRRADHIRIDRHQLGYLNGLQKLNCVYCGYANGLISYTREIASRTEAYWCPIKHATRVETPHRRYARFLDYGDGEGFRDGLAAERDRLRREEG